MEYSSIEFNNLSDEIFMIIFKKLNNLDVLYSLQGANQRINKIIKDPIFTNRLTFVKWLSDSFIDLICCDVIVDRLCLQILPEIHHKIKWLDLESSSMTHVLYAAHYPNLHSLGLYYIHEESLRCLFTDETFSPGTFKKQITTLLITIDNNKETREIVHYTNHRIKKRLRLFFDDPPPPTFRSSTLLKLSVRLQGIDDCLHLLDGRFNQLHTVYVDLLNLHCSHEIQNQQFHELSNNNENLSVIKYSVLNELIIIDVHDDYIEEFLLDTTTNLPNNIFLCVKYESLKRVTHNFTRDATRINCAKINELELFSETKCSNYLQEYFPYAKICYSTTFAKTKQ
ncbi:unnamed protein product [Rotaria sp. Silwood2]|nr:unnamed protein product [Rotaria sp. Silwood2]CAF4519336.1 unnamed protein product [Rotaria sp. Silwood2]